MNPSKDTEYFTLCFAEMCIKLCTQHQGHFHLKINKWHLEFEQFILTLKHCNCQQNICDATRHIYICITYIKLHMNAENIPSTPEHEAPQQLHNGSRVVSLGLTEPSGGTAGSGGKDHSPDHHES